MTRCAAMTFGEVLAHFQGVRRSGDDRATALCAAHEDRDPSLSMSRAENGRILLKCHAGCDFEAICEAAGLNPADLRGGADEPRTDQPRADSRGFMSAESAVEWMAGKLRARLTDTFVYVDAEGREVLRVLRFEPKTFRVLHRQQNGRWRFKDPPGRLPLYRLDKLLAKPNEPVLHLEGESCVHSAEKCGVLATTSPHGSKAADKSDWGPLAGREVITWPDADAAGEHYRDTVAQILGALNPPAKVRVIAPMYELGSGADIVDWIKNGGTAEGLEELIAHASPWRPTYPSVPVNLGQLRDVTEKTLAAIQAANDPAVLYVRNARIVRVRQDEDGRPLIDEVGPDELRHRATRAANFHRIQANEIKDVRPPLDVIKDILAAEELWPFPPIVGITEVPLLRPDGSVLSVRGYDQQTRLVYAPDPQLRIPKIPDEPSRDDAVRAVRFILEEVLIDFPFIPDGQDGEPASRANMLATILTPIIRPLIDGPVPLAMIDAPTAGSGKGLLSSATTIVASGRAAGLFSAPSSEDEWRKQITSSLLGGNTVIVIDNVVRTLASASLSAALTAPMWDARILGVSKNASVPVRVTWIATGNNMRVGRDMPRRCYWIRVDPETPRPWERADFKHPRLLQWMGEHRGEIVAALITLARAWHVAGAPKAELRLGSFESWTETVGGILEFVDVHGFLGNRAEMFTKADDDGPQWQAFLAAWHEDFGNTAVTVHEVTDRLSLDGPLKSALPDQLADALDDKSKSFTRRLGKALASIERRRFDDEGLRVERASKDRRANVQQWKVVTNEQK